MKQIFLSLIIILFSNSALAAEKYNYIDSTLILPEFISPPITNDKSIIEDIIKRQSAITDAEKAEISAEAKMRPEIMSGAVALSRDTQPLTFKILDKAGEDCKNIVSTTKDHWDTQRPYQADKRIKSFAYWPQNASYPSGHTACSRVMAEILGQLSPSKREVFRARASAIADHRVIGGMHWPNDLVGGEELALIIFGALQMSTDYKNDLSTAKSEWK